MIDTLRQAVLEWYILLSSFTGDATLRISELDRRVGIPLLSALLLGLIGAAAPCQLTTSVGALAVLGRASSAPRWRRTLSFLAGKTLVYIVLGTLVISIGREFAQTAIPFFQVARKILGPMMVIVGLVVAGVVHLSWASRHRLADRLRRAARQRAEGAPFLLGVAFGFSFCPTLFALFFGLLIPLALSRPDGVLYPALFAVGTSLPLLLALACVSIGGESLRTYARSIGRGQRVVAVVAGALLVAAGFHDTVVYWLL